MQFVPMTADHALHMKHLIGVHAEVQITEALAKEVEASGTAVSAVEDGEVLGIAGLTPKWDGTVVAWAWLSRKWKRHARAITGEILRNLERADTPRIEMAVRVDFPAGHRWARMLGFTLETPFAAKYGPDGRDYSVWVRT